VVAWVCRILSSRNSARRILDVGAWVSFYADQPNTVSVSNPKQCTRVVEAIGPYEV